MRHRVLYQIIACVLIAPVSIARQETLETPVYWISYWKYFLSPEDIPSKVSNLFKEHGYKLCPRPQPTDIKNNGIFIFQDISKELKELIGGMKIGHLPSKNLILFLWEPPTVILENANYMYWQQFFGKIITWKCFGSNGKRSFMA